MNEAETKTVLDAARKSQRQEKSLIASVKEAEGRDATLRSLTSATPDDVQQWLDELKTRRNTEGRLKGRLVCNDEQFAAVEKVASRVMRELRAEALGESDYGEPLRWVFHGGPGTGKSHVIKIIKKELFEGVLHWDLGVKFQVVALQAVMAQLLGGDTIHHALGIPVFKGKEAHGDDLQKHMDVAKRVLQWRWLIIDEISMASAKLFAEMDMKLRQVIRDVGTSKKDQGIDRPFGGLNIICSGDFWQLDPPDGGFLGDIPTEYIHNARQYKPSPTIAHGQALMWGGPKSGMQGVTELVECERCDNGWLREAQEEFRHGRLSETSFKFLHRRPTPEPGSWGGVVKCRVGMRRVMQLPTSLRPT